jgi:Tfp pilus assembly pilus retraction ATPase PilT
MNNFSTTFLDIEVPFVTISRLGTNPAIKHIYAFKNGKGTYGSGGTTVTASMLQYITTQNANTDDLSGPTRRQ